MNERKEILIKTKNKNNYLFSSYKNTLFYIHPLISFFIENFKEKDFQIWLDKFNKNKYIDIENIGKFRKKDLKYYYGKYLLYKNKDYLKPINIKEKTSGRIESHQIESYLANIRQVTFEVTDSCNLKCEYCGYGKFYTNYDKRQNKNIKIEYAKDLLNFLVKYWNSPLNNSHNTEIAIGFYGGEPLLNFKFIEQIISFLDNLKLKHNSFCYTITTNGILLDKHIDFLIKRKFNILVSLDGNFKNNQYRKFANGSSSFEKVIRNLKRIQKEYPVYFEKDIQFNAVLHNKNSFGEIYNYIKKTFNKSPYVSELNTTGISSEKQNEFWETYKNSFESLHETVEESIILNEIFIKDPLISDLARVIDRYSGYLYENYNNMFFDKTESKFIPTGTCLPFTRKLFLTVNGKILPCERIGHNYALGVVKSMGVSIDFKAITEFYNNIFDKINGQCATCFNFDNCPNCLLQSNNKELIKCKGFFNNRQFSDNFSSLITFLEKNPFLYNKIIKEVNYE